MGFIGNFTTNICRYKHDKNHRNIFIVSYCIHNLMKYCNALNLLTFCDADVFRSNGFLSKLDINNIACVVGPITVAS